MKNWSPQHRIVSIAFLFILCFDIGQNWHLYSVICPLTNLARVSSCYMTMTNNIDRSAITAGVLIYTVHIDLWPLIDRYKFPPPHLTCIYGDHQLGRILKLQSRFTDIIQKRFMFIIISICGWIYRQISTSNHPSTIKVR